MFLSEAAVVPLLVLLSYLQVQFVRLLKSCEYFILINE